MTTSIASAPEQIDVTTESRHAEYVKGLRAYADLLEAHPELPRPRDGQRAVEELVFFNGEDAVAHALTYIRAMHERPAIRVAPTGHYRLRVVGRIHDMHIELFLKADKADELRKAYAEQDGQVPA